VRRPGDRHPAGQRFAPDRRQPLGDDREGGRRTHRAGRLLPFQRDAGRPAARRAGIVEFGLPYASDPAITRHLAGFLRQHAQAAREALGIDDDERLPVPDTLLLNGGVFRGAALAQRLADVLSAWRGAAVRVLHNADPDVAVARGAVAYSLARQGRARARHRERLGAQLLPAAREGERLRAVCLLPARQKPGRREVRLAERSFALRLGRPVRFHLVSSVADTAAGRATSSTSIPPTSCACPPSPPCCARRMRRPRPSPVQLAAALSEVGTLESALRGRGWQRPALALEFQLRGGRRSAGRRGGAACRSSTTPSGASTASSAPQPAGRRARSTPAARRARTPAGGRERWETPLLRRLFDALMERAKGRRRSAEHERVWLNLAGWCLRPGFGHPLDDWRIEQLWALFPAGVQYHKDSQVRAEWWTLWRRVAGGLSRKRNCACSTTSPSTCRPSRRTARSVRSRWSTAARTTCCAWARRWNASRPPTRPRSGTGCWPDHGAFPSAQARCEGGRDVRALSVGAGARRRAPVPARQRARSGPAEAAGRWLATPCNWTGSASSRPASPPPTSRAGRATARATSTTPARAGAAAAGAAGRRPAGRRMVRDVVELDQASSTRMFGDALPPGLKLLR
jgi:hypothetical protein